MSQQQALKKVEEALGGRHPAYLSNLDPDQLEKLSGLIDQAQQHEQQALNKAIQNAVEAVPALLRKPLKRILFP